jgi:hypothetical protein
MKKRLRIGIARDNFMDLPRWSSGWQKDEASYYCAVAAAGYEAVMGIEAGPWRETGLLLFGHGVVKAPRDAEAYAMSWAEQGALAASCIAGTGMESDAMADDLVEAILQSSDCSGIPIYVETHRASITQDPWRCLRLTERHPRLRFNCDFSHWYTGGDIRAIDFEEWLKFMQPMLERVHMLHGRVGNRGCIQVGIAQAADALRIHQRLWTKVMQSFAKDSGDTNDIWFFPELLGRPYEYARIINGEEEADRWLDADLLVNAARDCAEHSGLDFIS